MRLPFLRRRGTRLAAGQNAALFVTWRLNPAQRPLMPIERDLICQVLRRGDGDRYRLAAFVVMDDHVHVLVQPSGDIERVVHSWKAFTAHELRRVYRRPGEIWTERTERVPVATHEDLRQRLERIAGNPWKRWPFVQRYPWVWEFEQRRAGWGRESR